MVFLAGKRAVLIRFSPPWSWREATSRSRQAERNSSWVQPSEGARPASRSTEGAEGGGLHAPAHPPHLEAKVIPPPPGPAPPPPPPADGSGMDRIVTGPHPHPMVTRQP